jgi:hypothetical protein
MRVDSVCTIGRQAMYVAPAKLASLSSHHNRCPNNFWDVYPGVAAWPSRTLSSACWGPPASIAWTIAITREQKIIRDLNKPLPDSLAEQYDLVYDGGRSTDSGQRA